MRSASSWTERSGYVWPCRSRAIRRQAICRGCTVCCTFRHVRLNAQPDSDTRHYLGALTACPSVKRTSWAMRKHQTAV